MAYTDKSEFKIPRHLVQPGSVNPETITVNKQRTPVSHRKSAI